ASSALLLTCPHATTRTRFPYTTLFRSPAVRARDRVRAPRPPAGRAVAPAWRRRHHLRVQLSARGARLGLGPRARLRRHDRVEAVEPDAAHLDRRAAGLPRGHEGH